MGYTHVQLLPVAEHSLDEPWGHRAVGAFAPASRYGTPQDFMFLIDALHRRGVGVILDWAPGPGPQAALDTSARRRDYGRREVRSFLLDNALFWLDKYHVDGLHVGGVGAVLHLDSSANPHGGQEDLEGLAFLRRFNERVYGEHPDVLTLAEEGTGWPMVSRPTYVGGLGFGLKWDVGWAHDTLAYMELEPIYRKHHHGRLTSRATYAFGENDVLPLAHDEVAPGKPSLLARMPGDAWQQFASLRLLYGYQYAQPGKKLLFMGGEIGQWQGWNANGSLDWHLLGCPLHQGLQRWVRDLNTAYRGEPALHQLDGDPAGFEWVDCNDTEQSVISLLRKGKAPDEPVLVVCNFTPVPRHNYRVGVSQAGRWEEVLNSDAPLYGGSGQGNLGGVTAAPVSWHGRSYLLNLTLPPLAMIALKRRAG
jgi:1,4-alpha-glucan branching enzyme